MEEVLEQPQLVKMAPGAIAKIKDLIAEENNPNLKLRMFVSGGGCSGMQYLQGAEVDYTESLQGSQFSIKNPQAQTTCGCGSSFSA